MSRHSIIYNNIKWPRAENLFQSLRFDTTHPMQIKLAQETNPMSVKILARHSAKDMVIEPRSELDLENMRIVLKLKLQQHSEVKETISSTGNREIIEDCSRRAGESGLFWGVKLNTKDHVWEGHNWLGRLWMELRVEAMADE